MLARHVQYTTVKFRRGTTVHANNFYTSYTTECGKQIKGGVRIVASVLTCVDCMDAIVKARKRAGGKAKLRVKSRRNAKRKV